jgi:hypothetical protein
MEKINVIVPIYNHFETFLQDRKHLVQLLKKHQTSTLSFEVFFVASQLFETPKNFKNLENTQLISTNKTAKNDLIQIGFSQIKEGATLVLELGEHQLEFVLQKLLHARKEYDIVRVKKIKHKQNKVVAYFKKVIIQVYELFLKLFSLEQDLLCQNAFQYFNENATQIICSMPQKNAYLRNFNALVGFCQTTLEMEVKKEQVLNKKEFIVIVAMVSIALAELFFVATLIFTSFILALSAGFILYLLMLVVSLFVWFFGCYTLVKIVLKNRANL